jgi:hypothetical protein
MALLDKPNNDAKEAPPQHCSRRDQHYSLNDSPEDQLHTGRAATRTDELRYLTRFVQIHS